MTVLPVVLDFVGFRLWFMFGCIYVGCVAFSVVYIDVLSFEFGWLTLCLVLKFGCFYSCEPFGVCFG